MVSQLTTESILCCVVLFSLIGNQSQGKKETEICVDREIDKERKAKQSKSDLKLHTYLSKLAFLLITTIIYCQSITRMGNRKWQEKLLTMSLTYVQWRLKAVRKFSILDRLI